MEVLYTNGPITGYVYSVMEHLDALYTYPHISPFQWKFLYTNGLVQISPFQWKFCTQTGL